MVSDFQFFFFSISIYKFTNIIIFFIGLFFKVFYGHLMPQSTYPDLAVCLDVSNPERFYAADHCLDETVLKNKVGFDD